MNVCVFEVNYLGDFICMMPTIAGLRKMMPEANITLVTSSVGEELIQHSELVDEILSFDFDEYRRLYKHPVKLWRLASKLRKRKFAASISAHDECTTTALVAKMAKIPIRIGFYSAAKGDFLYSDRLGFDPDLHVIENRYKTLAVLADKIGLPEAPRPVERVPIPYGDKENEKASSLIGSLDCKRVVAIHPFAKFPYKEWPVERFVEVAKRIVTLERDVGCLIITGGRSIPDVSHPRIQIIEQTTVLELAALLDKVDVFLGNNSGPMNIANAQGTPAIWISGPSPSYWDAFWNDAYLKKICADVPCRPCERRGYVPKKCTNEKTPMICMESVEVEQVLDKIVTALEKVDN